MSAPRVFNHQHDTVAWNGYGFDVSQEAMAEGGEALSILRDTAMQYDMATENAALALAELRSQLDTQAGLLEKNLPVYRGETSQMLDRYHRHAIDRTAYANMLDRIVNTLTD